MDKINELFEIIYAYDGLIEHWLDGDMACLYETSDGKNAYDFADELRNRAFEIIDELETLIKTK